MAPDRNTADGTWLRSGEARQRALGLLGESGQLAPSPDAAAVAYAVLALADSITDASTRVRDSIDQAANALDTSITEMGRDISRSMPG